MKIRIEEKCQKGYKTHEKRKTKKMFGKQYRNCVKAENLETDNSLEEKKKKRKKKRKVKKKKAKRDACYHKVKSRYDVWPSAYASGALVKCRKVGAKNWGNKSKKNEEIELEEKRNCGCGQDPCVTYGKMEEEFKPHDMYDPKTGEKTKANKEEDHNELSKKGQTHVDPDKLEDILSDEGGASGLDPLVKGTDSSDEEVEKTLSGMNNVGKHEDGDYIMDDGDEVEIKKEEVDLKKKIRIRIIKKIEEEI
ncbi:hypothetical protein N8467_00625 [bacterium]|nr:hypothetical protein [bacterium]